MFDISDNSTVFDEAEYSIEDPRPIREANPDSFFTPCQERLNVLAPGDFIKAIFKPHDPSFLTERMWVKITRIQDGVITGILSNDPADAIPLSAGDEIQLPVSYVIDILTDRKDDPVETNDNSRFFERCLVDNRIMEGAAIARIVRDEEEPADYHGKGDFGWSGWRFEADGYQPGMSTDVFALVVPIRIENGYKQLLQSPHGTVILYDPDKGWHVE